MNSILDADAFDFTCFFKMYVAQPRACSLHTPSAGPELPGREPSPHGRTVCPLKGLSWAGGNTGVGSVCAW